MMNCQQATRLLSDARERKLTLSEQGALKFHLLMCAGCRNFGKQMSTLGELSRLYAAGQGERSDEPDPPANR